ncbi:iron-sulfur cluster co-chaperone protein HscB isoform X2 [Amia ocellicauda]|uniref:iron-sulfur cluster co-chaperone protein HscB isoform X2 n=1 Tax=Amia ocellicauda TaxID=2972642 RepID=UPI003464DCA7
MTHNSGSSAAKMLVLLHRLRAASSCRGVQGLGLFLTNEPSHFKCNHSGLCRALTLNAKDASASVEVDTSPPSLLGCSEPNQSAFTPLFKTCPHGIISRRFCTVFKHQNCWKCGALMQETLPAFFCPACKVLQPPDEDMDYFDIMACEKSFAVDVQILQQKYKHLQRSLHPDNFCQKTKKEQEYSESQSAQVNRAYRTLLKPLSRGLYMLKLKGVTLEEGTNSGISPQFLHEIMEINERLAESQREEETSDIGLFIRGRLQELIGEISESFSKGDLDKAKGLLAEMKYFSNIEEKVKEKISQSG